MDVVVFHPWIYTRGGAEKLLLRWLERTRHDVQVYTWIYIPEKTFSEFERYNVTSLLPRALFEKTHYISRGIAVGIVGMLRRFVKDADALLISTAGIGELAAFLNHAPYTLAYVHTPLRIALKEELEHVIRASKLPVLKRLYYILSAGTYSMLERAAWKHFDAVLFNSSVSKMRAVRKGILRKIPNAIVWPGVDLPRRIPDQTEEGRILYLSRFARSKRQLELVQAWKLVEHKLPQNYKLVLAGAKTNPQYYDEVKKASKHHRIELYADLQDSEVRTEYIRAEACIFVGWKEDFGIAPLEALAWGKPLITVDEGGFWDVIREAAPPGVIPIRENEDIVLNIANALLHYVRHAKMWIEFGRRNAAALQRVDLSWDRLARSIDLWIKNELCAR